MERRKQNWGSVRSKLTQEGYMYRMKLGNTAPTNNTQPGHPPSSSYTPASGAHSCLSAEQRLQTHGVENASGAHKANVDLSTISRLLNQLDLSQGLNNEHELGSDTAMEFLSQCYAPYFIHRCHKTINCEPGNFLDSVMLRDNMLAQALVVWLLNARERFGPEPGGAGEVLLSQRSSVLRELRQRISSFDGCTSEPVMWTVLSLAATELTHDNMQAMGTHLGALRHTIHLRGGIDSPSVSKWIQILLLQFERYLNYRHFDHVQRASPEGMSPVPGGSYYPFPSKTRDIITEIPVGFAELFRTIHVNTQTFGLVERIHQWTEQIAEAAEAGREREAVQSVTSAMTLDSYRAFDLLQEDKLGVTEHLLTLGLLSFCIYMNDNVVYSIMDWGLRLHSVALVTKPIDTIEEHLRDSMTWVAATLMATGGRGSSLCRLGERIYAACRVRHWSLQVVAQTSQRYFWHTNLTEQLKMASAAQPVG